MLRGGFARLRGAEVVSGDGFAEGGGGVGDCCLGVGLCGCGCGLGGGLGFCCGGGVDGGEEVGDVLVDPGFVALDVFGSAGEPTAQFGFVEGFARGPLVGLFGVFAAQQGGALFGRDAEPFFGSIMTMSGGPGSSSGRCMLGGASASRPRAMTWKAISETRSERAVRANWRMRRLTWRKPSRRPVV